MKFWKTENWLEYLLDSKNENRYIDHSFYINDKFIPLIQGGEEFYSPYFDDDKEILLKIKELALKHNIKRIKVDNQIKSYLNISDYTCVLDLNNVKYSKGHKSAISKANKYLDYGIVEETKQFMIDYFKIAKRKTRPNESFEILEEWIKLGYATLLKATFENKTAGYVYIIHYDDYAYYFMSGTFEEYKKYNVNHFLLDKAFKLLKEKGYTHIELGGQVYNNLQHQPSEKEINISRFKRNFGGEIVLNFKSEYFFDRNYFFEIQTNRIINYMESEING